MKLIIIHTLHGRKEQWRTWSGGGKVCHVWIEGRIVWGNSKVTTGGVGARFSWVKLHRCGQGGERGTSCGWDRESGRGKGSWSNPHVSSTVALDYFCTLQAEVCLTAADRHWNPEAAMASCRVATGSGDRRMDGVRHLDWKVEKERAASFNTDKSLIWGRFIAVARKRSITHLIVRGGLWHTQLISVKSSINLSLAPSLSQLSFQIEWQYWVFYQ